MERPDDLTPEQEAILEAEEVIRDNFLESLEMFDDEEVREYLASLLEIGVYGKRGVKCAEFEDKCLEIHDFIARRKAGV